MKNIASAAFQYLIRILGIDLVLAIVVCAALALVERSLRSFGNWLLWAGVITLGIGLMGVAGHGGMTRSGSYPVAQTVGEQDIVTRTNADLKDETKSYSFLLLAAGAGVLAILISRLF